MALTAKQEEQLIKDMTKKMKERMDAIVKKELKARGLWR